MTVRSKFQEYSLETITLFTYGWAILLSSFIARMVLCAYILYIWLNTYKNPKIKGNKYHIFKFYTLQNMKGVFRAWSQNSIHSNFFVYHKQPDSFCANFIYEHLI